MKTLDYSGALSKNLTTAVAALEGATMEAGLSPVAMESLHRSPALVWAMLSAFVLCWGTSVLSNKKKQRLKNGPFVPSRLSRLRKEASKFLTMCAEELLYAYMAVANAVIGVIFYLLDFYHEGAPPPNANYFAVQNPFAKVKEPDLRDPSVNDECVLHKPRRAGIIRPRKVIGNACGCWGYEVEDIPPCSAAAALKSENGGSENLSAISQEEEEIVQPIRPRWSDCQCPECAVLLMPLKAATSRLFVRCDDMQTGGERCTDGRGQEFEVNTDLSKDSLRPMFASPIAAPNPQHNTPTRDSTAVIFLHGLFSSSSFWFDTKIVPRLSDEIKAQHRILAPDLLGCGRSPRPTDSAYILADHIEALEKSIIQRQGLKSFHLVAHSMGCIMALVLAARCPERVRSITLIAPVYPPGDVDENGNLDQLPCDAFFSYINPFTVKGFRALLVSKYYNISRAAAHLFYARHKFWVNYWHKKLKKWPVSFIADYITNQHDAGWHMTHNSLLGGTHAVIPALIKLQKHQTRIFVYHGVEDTSCRISLSEEMAGRFSNVELHSVPDFGHVDVLWKREEEPCRFIEREIVAGDANFAATQAR